MASGQTRLSRERRREHLLDVAAELVSELGPDALTMEGLAQRAGVSKALPYRHFADAEDLLVALVVREAGVIAERTKSVVRPDDGFEVGIRASLGAYFDVVEQRGALLGALFQYRFGESRQRQVQGVWSDLAEFHVLRFAEEFGLTRRLARVAAYTALLAVVEGQELWTAGLASRKEMEELLAHMIVDGLVGFSSSLARTAPGEPGATTSTADGGAKARRRRPGSR